MSTRESTVEKRVTTWAKDHGISTLKLGGAGNRGKTDRIFMKNGTAVFCELKRPGMEATPLQKKFIKERQADRFEAACFDNAPDAIKWLGYHLLE